MFWVFPIYITEALSVFVYIALCAAPLEQFKPTIETRNEKYIDIKSAFASFLCCNSYLAYAILSRDIVVGISNFIGLLLAVLQIIMYFWAKRIFSSNYVRPILRMYRKLADNSVKEV